MVCQPPGSSEKMYFPFHPSYHIILLISILQSTASGQSGPTTDLAPLPAAAASAPGAAPAPTPAPPMAGDPARGPTSRPSGAIPRAVQVILITQLNIND